ncbi:2-amino-4-hydroxy-6-hydroxymethyldihydropteridine diphosphokinase [Paeniroseomonas aquatica]|uniref:2-amino-4-hydroxy-6- hydroxymethyldihydropteridine diphosphokinase n=1 Tax=Paeniroseomonas aquatica TaxID=373043 RepID=UPI00360811EC
MYESIDLNKAKKHGLYRLRGELPDRAGAPPLATCRSAAAALDRLPGWRLVALSRWYATTPVPPVPGVPLFVNGVARLDGAGPADPAALLAALQGLEAAAGRERPYPNAPRVLDLDIIDLDGLLLGTPELALPHPRAHLRRFVLAPLADVAPGWVHPRLGLGVAALLAGLPPEPPGEGLAEPLPG